MHATNNIIAHVLKNADNIMFCSQIKACQQYPYIIVIVKHANIIYKNVVLYLRL